MLEAKPLPGPHSFRAAPGSSRGADPPSPPRRVLVASPNPLPLLSLTPSSVLSLSSEDKWRLLKNRVINFLT